MVQQEVNLGAGDRPGFGAPSPVVWRATLVFGCCYAGALLGSALTFPQAGAALLFVPYGVVLIALLSSRVDHWWAYLTASTLGTFAAYQMSGAPAAFAALAEVANVVRALVAAGTMRALGFRSVNDPRGTWIFLVGAALLGPAAGATIGAATVASLTGGSFTLAWQEWLLSNMITALTVVPAFHGLLATLRARPAWGKRRLLEAVALGVLLASCTASAFFSFAHRGTLSARLCWPLPFMLWAAVRFGTRGMGAALSLVALLSAAGALRGLGPFAGQAPAEALLDLQLFLIALSVPLLLLASFVQQTRRTKARLLESQARYQSTVEAQQDALVRYEAERRSAHDLRESGRRKDEFLTMLAHELRSPLAPAVLGLELLEHQYRDPKARPILEVIARQLNQLRRLVDDLLDLSQIARGSVSLDLEVIDLREVVGLALETSRPTLESKRHRVSVNAPGDAIRVRGDLGRLTQVVVNLLNNAAKYTNSGGEIVVSVARASDWVTLSVRDNGIGMAADQLQRIFELFVRVTGSGPEHPGGLGVGLTLVRGFVELHDGTVEALSDGPGRGTELLLRLPAFR
jgi:signal transduction histidine kinase